VRAPNLKFNEERHEYRIGSLLIPSVTQINGRVAVRANDEDHWHAISGENWTADGGIASNFGKALHSYCAMRLNGYLPESIDMDPAAAPWCEAWEHWYASVGAEKTYLDDANHDSRPAIEYPLAHVNYGYAGTLDWLSVTADGAYILTDWKTGETFGKTWWAQVAAYAKAAMSWFELPSLPATRIVQILPTGCKVSTHKPAQVEQDWNVFCAILTTYRTLSRAA
jgi:hypothetical protein